MTEVWKSQENRFCKYCKCWVADNKVSWQTHENGLRHKQTVEEKLLEIKRKQVQEAKSQKDEAHWLKKMEEAALRDYKKKDIKSNRDFTAKLYNNEDLPDVDVRYEHMRKSHEIGPKLPDPKESKRLMDPILAAAAAGPDGVEKKILPINPVKASASGTKWHKPSPPKFWYEARTEEGHSYYWNVNTKESRWDTPPSGFVSVEEQEKLESQEKTKQHKKAKIVHEQRAIHLDKEKDDEVETSRVDPYGTGGWKTIPEKPAAKPVNLGLPAPSQPRLQPVIQAEPERRSEFKERTVASLGGLGAAGTGEGGEGAVGAKPVISFRKRKNNAVRQRDDD